MMPVRKKENASATGAATAIPYNPQSLPKIKRQGIKAMNCRNVVRNIDIFGLPVATKKFEEII